MKIQVFISTINNDIHKIDRETLKYKKINVINQVPNLLDNKKSVQKIDNITWIDIDQKGLSKSRNLALMHADEDTDVVYLTDDDIVLDYNFEKIITRAFQKNPECDILAFNIKGIEKEFKKEVKTDRSINLFTSMKLSSVQIVFKLDFLRNNNLWFDERFGAGAKYSMGEENILLFDAIKKGATIKFIPETIAQLHMGDSTWFQGFNQKYLFDKGASFWRMFGFFAPVYSLTYCIRKHELYKRKLSFIEAYKSTLQGMKSLKV